MSIRNFVCRRHLLTSNRSIRQLITPNIKTSSSSSSSLPLLGIQFSLRKRHYILLTEEVEEPLLLRRWQEETTPTNIYLTHSVYMSDDFSQEISKLIGNWNSVEFQDERNSIIENTMRQVRHLIKHDSNKGRRKLEVCVDLELVNVCMGRYLVPEEEIGLSQYRMVPASKSSMKLLLKKMEIDEEKYEECCVVCLDELVKESDDDDILCMPCSHMFHGDCITKWLETSHFCPICRFQMPTEQD